MDNSEIQSESEPTIETELKQHEENDGEIDTVLVDAIAACVVKIDDLEIRVSTLEKPIETKQETKRETKDEIIPSETIVAEPLKPDDTSEAKVVDATEQTRGRYRKL